MLLYWSMGKDENMELGLLTPEPRPATADLAQLLDSLHSPLNASEALFDLDALDDAQLSAMQQARQWVRYIMYMFTHAELVHLLNNCAVQVASGLCMEMLHGTLRTAFIYVTSGITAALAFTAIPRGSFTLLVGSSAACCGLAGAQMANCILNWAEMPFRWLRIVILCAYLLFYLLFALAWPIANSAHLAHAFGLVQGLLLGLCALRNFVVHQWERRLQLGAAVAAAILFVTLVACNVAGTGGSLSL